jgi:hypothetical protein
MSIDPKPRTAKVRRQLGRLERRAAYLVDIIADQNGSPASLQADASELSALLLATDAIRTLYPEHKKSHEEHS